MPFRKLTTYAHPLSASDLRTSNEQQQQQQWWQRERKNEQFKWTSVDRVGSTKYLKIFNVIPFFGAI